MSSACLTHGTISSVQHLEAGLTVLNYGVCLGLRGAQYALVARVRLGGGEMIRSTIFCNPHTTPTTPQALNSNLCLGRWGYVGFGTLGVSESRGPLYRALMP